MLEIQAAVFIMTDYIAVKPNMENKEVLLDLASCIEETPIK